jgi:hypothetical protein
MEAAAYHRKESKNTCPLQAVRAKIRENVIKYYYIIGMFPFKLQL